MRGNLNTKMSRQIINITDITEYLYCPRKVYLKLVKGIRTPPNQRMILGMLRHKTFDLFNKQEQILISGITEKIPESEISQRYMALSERISRQIMFQNENLARSFGITELEFKKSVAASLAPEIILRASSVSETIKKGFLAKELWRELYPKYLTEYKIISEELGLQGRIDRIQFLKNFSPVPVEVKTRERIFDSDKIQLAGYSLLLEKEFSKQVTSGIIELMGKQHQVELTPELKASVLEIAEKIRNLKEETASMPSNFAKCRNCSFAEECSL